MSLVEHALSEMKFVDFDKEVFPNSEVMELIELFAEQGHSGSSAMWTLEVFDKLARFQPLTPLTDNPNEWMLVTEDDGDGKPTWQSRRQADAFSRDEGKTYYLVDDMPRELHKTQAAS